ncbi:MAG: NHLP bacteriocin system secretion protein [Bryobacteraceae bacterium]
MASRNTNLYRAKALERFASPDNLERLVPAVHRRDWMPVLVTGVLFGLALFWAFAGSVPTVVSGRGVLLKPRRVVRVQSLGGGRLLALTVRAGDEVQTGQIIGKLDQSEIRKRIEEDRATVATLTGQDHVKTASDQQRLQLQLQQDAAERSSLAVQRSTLEASLANAQALVQPLEEHRAAVHEMVKQGLLGRAAHDVSDAEFAYRDNDIRIAEYKAKLSEIDGQTRQIATREAQLDRETLESTMARHNQVGQINDTIALNEVQLRQNGDIRSEFAGRVMEVLATPGQVLAPGTAVLSLQIEDPDSTLTSISYFPIADGKKIQPGMRIQVTPDTVERQRFGGILSTVTKVSPLPVTREGALSVIGNPDVVQSLMSSGAYIEVTARLETDPATFSGYRWSSSRGPNLKMSSGLTHLSRVTIEGRAPITYLMPILRESSGIY